MWKCHVGLQSVIRVVAWWRDGPSSHNFHIEVLIYRTMFNSNFSSQSLPTRACFSSVETMPSLSSDGIRAPQ
jgi:hypothetical protein